MQHHLDELHKRTVQNNKRNCACFTPDGVVYTKIKSDRDYFPSQRRTYRGSQNQLLGRNKRSVDDNDVNDIDTKEADDSSEVFFDEMTMEMAMLLQLSAILTNLENEQNFSQPTTGHHLRRKREAIDHISTVIQVFI